MYIFFQTQATDCIGMWRNTAASGCWLRGAQEKCRKDKAACNVNSILHDVVHLRQPCSFNRHEELCPDDIRE